MLFDNAAIIQRESSSKNKGTGDRKAIERATQRSNAILKQDKTASKPWPERSSPLQRKALEFADIELEWVITERSPKSLFLRTWKKTKFFNVIRGGRQAEQAEEEEAGHMVNRKAPWALYPKRGAPMKLLSTQSVTNFWRHKRAIQSVLR